MAYSKISSLMAQNRRQVCYPYYAYVETEAQRGLLPSINHGQARILVRDHGLSTALHCFREGLGAHRDTEGVTLLLGCPLSSRLVVLPLLLLSYCWLFLMLSTPNQSQILIFLLDHITLSRFFGHGSIELRGACESLLRLD